MYSYVGNRWHKTVLSLIKIFVCFTLVYTPFFANAGAAEKWEILENAYDTTENSVRVTAKKITQDAANSGVYKVKVPVSAATLGSTVKSMFGIGLAVASVTALVEAVGWVIDQGKIYETVPPTSPTDPNLPFIFADFSTSSYIYVSARDAMQAELEHDCQLGNSYCESTINSCTTPVPNSNSGTVSCSVTRPDGNTFSRAVLYKKNLNYDPYAPQDKREVTDSELGTEIMGEGTNTVPKTDLIQDAYNPNNPVSDAPAPQQTNDALNSANPQPETEPTGQTAPLPNKDTNGDGVPDEYAASEPKIGDSFTLPNFCEWAPAVCDFFSWAKNNDDLPDESPIAPKDLDIGALDTGTFTATAGCPAPIQVPIDFGNGGNIEISYEPICQMAEKWSFVAPLIGFISGAMILVGVGRKGEDGEI